MAQPWRSGKTTYKVMNEYVALTMVSMMRGVVESGTATAAGSLGVQLAGKTGTVNDHTGRLVHRLHRRMSPESGWVTGKKRSRKRYDWRRRRTALLH